MPNYTIKSYDEIVADMTASILASAPQISDLSPGSIILSFCQAAGISLEELYVEMYLGFQRALQTVAPDKFNFTRKDGTYAQGAVTFTAATAPAADITIPIGTRVQTSSSLVYDTTVVATISAGNTTSASTSVQAEETGSIYNISTGTALTMVDDVNGVSSVSLTTAATQGTDSESDFQYQSRFQSYIEGLAGSNSAGLKAAALGVTGVTSASVQEYLPPTGSAYATGTAVFTASGTVSSTITIPSGTYIADTSSTPGYLFYTTAAGSIPTGTDVSSGSIPIQAFYSGASFNLAIGSVTTLLTQISGVTSVTNDTATTGGVGQVSANVWIDNGSTTGAPASLVTSVQTVLDGDGTTTNPGYRAAGVNVVAVAAGVVAIDVVVEVVPTSANVSASTIETDIQTAITAYVNGLGVAEDAEYFEISAAIMGVYGVQNIYWPTTAASSLTVNSAAQDVSIGSGQVARVGTITVTVS